jgi:hypothetical protein
MYKPVSRQRIGKHVPVSTNSHIRIELLFETVSSMWSVQRCYEQDS